MPDFKTITASQQITPAPVADMGAPHELLAKKLQAFNTRIMAQRSGLMSAKAEEEGGEAGSKIGFKPIKEFTSKDIIFNKAAIEAQKGMIQNRVRNTSMGYRNDSITNLSPTSLHEYDKRYGSFGQEMTDSVSPALKEYTKNMLSYYGLSNRQPVVSAVKGLNNNIATSNLQLSVNNGLQDASKAAFTGDQIGAGALRGQTKQKLDAALAAGLVSPTYHANTIEAMDRTIKVKEYEGQYNRGLKTGNGAKVRASLDKKLEGDVDQDTIDTKFNGMLTRHKQDLIATQGNILNKNKDLESAVLLNGVNAATQGQISKQKAINSDYYQDDPSVAQKLNDELDFSKDRHDWRESIKYSPVTEISEKLQSMHQGLKKKGSAVTEQDMQHFDMLTKDAVDTMKQWKDDPYTLAAKHPSVVKAMQQERSSQLANYSVGTGDNLGKATEASIADVDNSLISVQQQKGVPKGNIQIIPKMQLLNLASQVSNASPQEGQKMIMDEVAQHQDHRGIALSNIQKYIKPANMMALNMAVNPDTAKHAAYGQEAMISTAKELEDTVDKGTLKDDTKEKIMKQYGDAILNKDGAPTKLLASIDDYAYKLALIYKRDGIADPAGQAVNDAVLAHSQIGTYNGFKYVIPKPAAHKYQYTPAIINDSTEAYVNSLDESKLSVPDYFPKTTDDLRENQRLYKNYLVSHAYPATFSDNTGVKILDDSKIPVKDINRHVLGFRFDDLPRTNSDINTISRRYQTKKLKKNKEALALDHRLAPAAPMIGLNPIPILGAVAVGGAASGLQLGSSLIKEKK